MKKEQYDVLKSQYAKDCANNSNLVMFDELPLNGKYHVYVGDSTFLKDIDYVDDKAAFEVEINGSQDPVQAKGSVDVGSYVRRKGVNKGLIAWHKDAMKAFETKNGRAFNWTSDDLKAFQEYCISNYGGTLEEFHKFITDVITKNRELKAANATKASKKKDEIPEVSLDLGTEVPVDITDNQDALNSLEEVLEN